MDRSSCRCCSSVLVFLLLSGCVSSSGPNNATDNQTHNPNNNYLCSGNGGSDCAVGAGAMLILSMMLSPPKAYTAEDKKHRQTSISGRCELQIGGKIKPCQGVLLTLEAPGYSRKAWIMDNDFEVTGIKAAKFDLKAYSEEYQTVTALKNVPVGSQIKIQLVVPAK